MVRSRAGRTAGVAAGVTALVLGLGACSDDEASSSAGSTAAATEAPRTPEETPASEEPEATDARSSLRTALETTQQEEAASIELAVTTDVGGTTSATEGRGVVAVGDEATAELTLTLPEEAGGQQVEVIVVDGVSYVQLPEGGETGLPPEAAGKYLRIDPSDPSAAGFGGLGELGGSATGFSDSLEQLAAAESVESAGTGEVEGDEVDLYTVTTSTSAALGGSAPPEGVPETITYTVAVDSDDLIREVRSSTPLDLGALSGGSAPPETSGTVDVTFTVVEYGVDLDIEAPPEDEVVDLSELTGG